MGVRPLSVPLGRFIRPLSSHADLLTLSGAMVKYEVLCRRNVKVEGRETRIPCSPLDSFVLIADQQLSFHAFFDYDLNGERLLKSLEKVAAKYPCLCGRVTPDPQSRFAIEVSSVTEESNGFPFTEARADISDAETVVKHVKMRDESPKCPSTPPSSFFMDTLSPSEMLSGKSPMAKVKLTHLQDGCVVNLALAHLMVDGVRSVEMFRDISLAYCGQEVPERNHDRSWMWPDRLAEHYPFLGEEVARLPRTCVREQQIIGFPETYGQPRETEALYFSKDELDSLKARVAPFLSQGEFVSSNDVLLALLWMVKAEVAAEKSVMTVEDLRLHTRTVMAPIECAMAGVPALPQSYCGNAAFPTFHAVDVKDLEGKSFKEAHAFLAQTIRKGINDGKQRREVQAQSLLSYYHFLNSSEFRNSMGEPEFTLSNLMKAPVEHINFGEGQPALLHIAIPVPSYGAMNMAGPGPRNDGGIIVNCQFLESELKTLEKSVVIKSCAPGMKRLYSEFSVDEMKAFLGMN